MKKCLAFLCIAFLCIPSSTSAALSFWWSPVNQSLYPAYSSTLPDKKTLVLDIMNLKTQIEAEYANGKIVIQGLNSIIEKAWKSKNVINGLLFKYQLKKLRATQESEKLFYSYTIKKLQLALVIIEELEDTSVYPEIEKHVLILQKNFADLFSQSVLPSLEQSEQKGNFTFSFNLDTKDYGKIDFELWANNIKILRNKEDYDISLDFWLKLKWENLEAIWMKNIDMQIETFFDTILKKGDTYLLVKNLKTSWTQWLPYIKEVIDGLKKIANENKFVKIKKTSVSSPVANTYISKYSLQASKIDKKKIEEFTKTSLFNVMEKNGDTYTLTPKRSSCKLLWICKTKGVGKITLSGVESGKYIFKMLDSANAANTLEISYTPSEIEKISLNISETASTGVSKWNFSWDKWNISANFSTSKDQTTTMSFQMTGTLKKDTLEIKSSFSFEDPMKGYSQDARNSKITSDMFSYMSLLNIKATEWVSYKNLIVQSPIYKGAEIWVWWEKLVIWENYFIWTPNYEALWLKKDDFKMPDGSEYIIAATTKSGGRYEIYWHIENKSKKIATIKWDYVPREKQEINVTSTWDNVIDIGTALNINKFTLGDTTNLGKVIDVSPDWFKLTLSAKVPTWKNILYLLHDDSESLITSENGEPIRNGDTLWSVTTKPEPEEKIQWHLDIASSKNGVNQKGAVDFSISHSKYGSVKMTSTSSMTTEGKILDIKAPTEYKEMDVSELNPYEVQLKKARDSTRILDIKTLQMAIEQAYQDNFAYPKKSDFLKSVKPYLYAIPKDSLSWKVVNGCIFWYNYEVWPDSKGNEYGAYVLSTCFESVSNIDSKAKNDWGTDPIRFEVWIFDFWKWKTEKFIIDSLK